MNRIIDQVATVNKLIETKGMRQDELDTLNHQLDMQFDEYVALQELKSLASVDGTLTLDEGMSVYGFLGNTLEHANKQPTAVKIVLTKLLKELLDKKIKSRK